MNSFTNNTFAQVQKPVAEASTLPPHVYTSREWYDREVNEIFKKSWLILTREELVPNPGDYVRVDIVGETLIVTRTRQGEIKTL